MQLKFASVMVDDQARALAFYTDILGFQKMADIPMGEYRWLTVTSPDGVPGMELVLEPRAFPPARDFCQALYGAGMPAIALISRDLDADVARLKARGVRFHREPQAMGMIRAAVFDDTCGNFINLVQPMVGAEAA